MSSSLLPLIRAGKPFRPLIEKTFTQTTYRTSQSSTGSEWERTADLSLNRAETWLTSLYVRIDPAYVPVGDLRVITWDSNNATGNPADPTSSLPDVRMIDSPNLTPGEFFYVEPPTSAYVTVHGEDGVDLITALGLHFEYGFRVQVIDTTTNLPIEDAARFVVTFTSCPSNQ